MKIRILDRILVALAGLLMLAGGAALAAQLFFGKDIVGKAGAWLNNESLRLYIIIGGVAICLIGLYCFLLLFRHKGKKGKFIMQRTENGELAISLKALESMVQKCLEQHKEVNAQSVNLNNQKGSLLIKIRGTVAGGVSIPLTVDTLQQQIRQYVTACSGVEVRDIRVEIDSSGPEAKDAPFAIEAPAAKGLLKGASDAAGEMNAEKPEQKKAEAEKKPEEGKTQQESKTVAKDELAAAAEAAALLMNKAPEENDDRPMHQRLFSTVEEPCVMPMPPMKQEDAARKEEEPASQESKPGEDGAEEKKTEEAKTEDAGNEEKKENPENAGEGTEENADNKEGAEN